MERSTLAQPKQKGSTRTEYFVYAACIVASASWALLCGKDMNWDQLNYHFYAAYNLLDGRLHKDFLAASIQGYLNPLGYIPFYWMVTHNWHSIVITTILASFHAINLILIHRISLTIIAPNQPCARGIAALSTTLALLSPVYLLEVGTSFIDITTSTLVLLGLLLSLSCRQVHKSTRTHPVLLAGICLGAAAGLKSTNIIFGPACAIALFFLVPNRKDFWRASLMLTAGSLVGTLITYGYWGLLLWREFGNPFFPYFNSVFLSPDFFPYSFQHQRFLPQSASDYLTLPFRMAELRNWVYLENFAPDLRFALLLIVGVVTAIYSLSKIRSPEHLSHPAFSPAATATFVFFIVSYILWVWTSGNGRYGIVVSLLCGPTVVHLASWLMHSNQRACMALLTVLITAQSIHVGQGGTRWSTEPWTNQWFKVQIPDNLENEPALYLSIGAQSNSYVFPYLHKDSAFANPIGQISIGLDSPGGIRLRNMIEAYTGKINLLSALPVDKDLGQPDTIRKIVTSINSQVAHLDLGTSTEHCTIITTAGPSHEPLSGQKNVKMHARQLLSCKAQKRTFSSDEATERRQVEALFESARGWCPQLFGAAGPIVERLPDKWLQYFVETDVTLALYRHQFAVFVQKNNRSLILGHQKLWEENGIRPSCEEASLKLHQP